MTTDLSLARKLLAAFDPFAVAPWFAPEYFDELGKIGLEGWAVYFCSRAAPMGPVPAEVVIATFFNWNPVMIRREIRWDPPSVADVLSSRLGGAKRTFDRLLGDLSGDASVKRGNELLKIAADACPLEGRPLFAGHLALPWPTDPLLGLWHGATLMREFRGDSHIAVLVSHGVGPIDALVLSSPWIGWEREKYLQNREWTLEDAKPSIEKLEERGFLAPDGSLTEGGEKFREMIELDTDRRAIAPAEALGPDGVEEIFGIVAPLSRTILAAKGAPGRLGKIARGMPLGK